MDGPDDAASLVALFLHAFPSASSEECPSDLNAAVTGGSHSPIADPSTLDVFCPSINGWLIPLASDSIA
ncbi:uncharacterized protein CTRU02_203497 [Colletotrichum truncatum]|uniref:Uncharacterized protein n=1 Tax=Colletotrichum truncatum TaxID=5467 RepID=A0ACC3Z9H0_COLTU|nr:uncharacterized protein CTRU02_05880 [Colletotrichum truncatum]KAF6793625.1 hypothetical protein CTRU02_05880 [Colletotrichum truncatum]